MEDRLANYVSGQLKNLTVDDSDAINAMEEEIEP
jgi:hypothetical protein